MRPAWRLACAAMVVLLGGCNAPERLANIGKPPDLNPIENPLARSGYRPVQMPMPEPEPVAAAGANTLWRSGARGFFRDQRARRVGDILTIEVTIADSAELSNETSRSRSNDEDLAVPNIFGFETKLDKLLPAAVNPLSLVDASSAMSNRGVGEVTRDEEIDVKVAAVVTQVLPNGNLVLEGRQEVRVNFEVREIQVAGIVRPEDITPRNTIEHEKIAELRVGYGGRGQISDIQQPRYGAQVLDILLPF